MKAFPLIACFIGILLWGIPYNTLGQKKVKPSLWKPKEGGYDRVTYQDYTILIFEDQFNDTLWLKVNDTTIAREYIETNRSLSRVIKDYKISRAKEKQLVIEMVLTNSNDHVKFKFKKRYRYLYIKRSTKGVWFVNYSNYKREYY